MILDVRGVRFRYPGSNGSNGSGAPRPVLDGVDFRVAPGELVAILGPNGVGKTTLLKCINAIHRPRGGAVLVDGRDVLAMNPRAVARRVGYVAQRHEPAPLTVFDGVLMGRMPRMGWQPGPADLAVVDAVLRRLGLDELALRRMDQLSGGEVQKVAVARALVQEPRLLLLDEPTSALDLRNQMEILTLLRGVVDGGADSETGESVAAVMTMHDLNAALRFADTVLFLKDGVIHACGPACEVQATTIEEVYGLPVDIHRVGARPVVIPC